MIPTLPNLNERNELLAKVGKSLLETRFSTWNFGDSVGFEAIIATGQALDDPTYLAYAHGWMRSWASMAKPLRRMDCVAPGLAMVEVSELTGDTVLLESLVPLARFLMSRTTDRGLYDTWESLCLIPPYGGEKLPPYEALLLAEPPGGTCVDCLHFDPPFFTSLGRALEQDEFIEVGVNQALGYIEALQTPSGIFDHFFLNGVPGNFGPGWGRGQGWALLGMLDVLKNISVDHVHREVIVKALRKLISGMIELQREDGRWWCVVDSPVSGEEGSTAAFMAAGFARAIKMNLVDEKTVKPAFIKALAGAIDDTDEKGHLKNVTAAVYASTRKSHYEFTPRGHLVPWGQGPLALALCEAIDLV